MQELALHLLDLVQNSIEAGAGLVDIRLCLGADARLTLTITDDGRGMDETMAAQALSPFTTSRTTRRVGLGLPLARATALRTGGSFALTSEAGSGTTVTAVFDTAHIDCPPLGKLADTLTAVILANPVRPDFAVHIGRAGDETSLSTKQIKDTVAPVPLNQTDVALWLTAALHDMTEQWVGGITA